MDEQVKKLQHPANWQYGSPLDSIAEKWTARLAHDPESPIRVLGMNRHLFHDLKAFFIAAVAEAAPIKSSWIELRHEVAWEPRDMLWMLRNDGVKVIHANRQTGKTTEMLKYATERYGLDFAWITKNDAMANAARNSFRTLVSPTQRITNDVDTAMISIPLFVSVYSADRYLRGTKRMPVFVDEWGMFSESEKAMILEYNFHKAVTS